MRGRIGILIFSVIFFGLNASSAEPKLWSLQAVRSVSPPELETDWARTDIDFFIAGKWESKNLKPVGDAAENVLVRRLYFNLIGLPPTPEQLDLFAKEGFDITVETLLASPHFGEKWGRHWLDLARYSESNGADRNVVFAHAWRYRDWVIDALNRDMPYDQFIREQIAGDLLPGAGDSQLVATGFLTLGPKSFQEPDREKFLMDMVDEQIDVMSRSILGLTIACSRCHDHKFDPIPQADYYALAGIFLSSDTLHGPGPLYFQDHKHNKPVLAIGPDKEKLDPGVQAWRDEIYSKTVEAMRLRSAAYKIRRKVTGTLREKGLKKPENDPDLLKQHLESEGMYAKAKQLLEEREASMKLVPAKPGYAMVMQEMESPEDCLIRTRGVHNEYGEAVPRGRLTIPGLPSLDDIGGESGRRQLADWLVSKENPLTARVIVNRVWHQLFGSGLVNSVDNFGVNGSEPSHPELLDYLAYQFVEEDHWSLKSLIRRIVSSRTWQLSSRVEEESTEDSVDPANTLYSRANFRRLDVEAFHDSVLTVSGELDRSPPADGSLLSGAFLGSEYGKRGPDGVLLESEWTEFRHRAVYLPVIRDAIPEIFKQFDFADPNTTTGSRNARTIPGQALFLMNDEFVETQAKLAALRVSSLKSDSLDRSLTWLGKAAHGAPFSPEQKLEMKTYLDQRTAELKVEGRPAKAASEEAWTDLFQAVFSGIDFRYME